MASTIDLSVIKSAEFVKTAVNRRQYPPADFPEIAFAGRSNVGKSSLINSLVRRKKLVRTSRTPGRTQTINFFLVNTAIYFVDLPGYGYAKVSQSIRAKWGPMVESYILSRKSLCAVVQIMDIRRPPTPDDMKLWFWLASHRIPAIPVLTKADRIQRSKKQVFIREAGETLGMDPHQLICFSAVTGEGRMALLERIQEHIRSDRPGQ